MGVACSNCQVMRTEQEQQEQAQIVTKKQNKSYNISQSRLAKIPQKQQTLSPLNYELGNEENDEDIKVFENQFVSIQKTATFHSQTAQAHQLQSDEKQSKFENEEVKKVEESKQTVPWSSSNNKQIENQVQNTDIQLPQSPNQYMYSCPKMGNDYSNKVKEQVKSTSAKNLEQLPVKSNLKKGNEKKPPLERKNTNKSLKNDGKKVFNEAQSMKANDASEDDLTPSKKGILKNKGVNYNRAKSLYSREKSQDNISCKSSCSKKRVKFDPKTYRQKSRNFMFI